MTIMKMTWARMILAVLATNLSASAQLLNNQALNGQYFFRQVSLGTDSSGNLTDPRSMIGAITFFPLTATYSFVGQQINGNNAAIAQSGGGGYNVDPAGFVTLANPLRLGATINARIGPEALLGSGTESSDNTFDLFVAIPAGTFGAVLSGPYWTASLEFPGGSTANARDSIFSLNGSTPGNLAGFSVSGHAANISGGIPITQQVSGATYTTNADGSGILSFGTTSSLLSGNRAVYVSKDGNVILGGSTVSGSHDILIGVKAVAGASNSTWYGDYWGAGLRVDPTAVTGYAGAATARGSGNLTWTQRQKVLGHGNLDLTESVKYSLNADGSGTSVEMGVGLGAGAGAFVGADINEASGYEIYFGVQRFALSGTGIFLNPQGVVSAANFAPAGNPIAPGEFIALYGTGFAKGAQSAAAPYPPTLNGVTVLINNKTAPLYYVGAGEIDCVVPYSTQGPTANIVVQSGSSSSNTVTVPVAATAPGVFSVAQSGSGPGAILHADYSLVTSSKPAVSGETVLIYLTGMGAVNPAVADGTAGMPSPSTSNTVLPMSQIVVQVGGGTPATVTYSGLAPGFPGLYQLNVQLPSILPGSGSLPLAIGTPNALHNQVNIAIGQ